MFPVSAVTCTPRVSMTLAAKGRYREAISPLTRAAVSFSSVSRTLTRWPAR